MLAPANYLPHFTMMIANGATPMLLPNGSFLIAKPLCIQKGKAKSKPQNTESHRAGDWVCILCHNLNYSFRKVCNRCQVQTKRENLLQSLSLLGNKTDEVCCPVISNKTKEESLRKESPPGLDYEDVSYSGPHAYKMNTCVFESPIHSNNGKQRTLDNTSTQGGSTYSDKWNDENILLSPTVNHYELSPQDEDQYTKSAGAIGKGYKLFEDSNQSSKAYNVDRSQYGFGSGGQGDHHQNQEHELGIMRSMRFVLEDNTDI